MRTYDPDDLPDPNPFVDIDGDPIEIGTTIEWEDDLYKVTGYAEDSVGPLLNLVGLGGMYQSKYRPMRPEKYRAMQRAEQQAATKKRKKRSRKKGGNGKCEHCGDPTGGKFAVGHDAKLKGELLSGYRDGDAEAGVEMVLRGWRKPKWLEKDAPDANTRMLAEGMLAEGGLDGWLDARIKERQNE